MTLQNVFHDVNGVIISKREIEPSNSISVEFNDKINLKNGEKLTTYAMIQDKYGLNYKYFVNVFVIENYLNLDLEKVAIVVTADSEL